MKAEGNLLTQAAWLILPLSLARRQPGHRLIPETDPPTATHHAMKSRALNLTTLALLPAALVTLTSCSSTPPPAPQASSASSIQEGVPGGVFVNTLDVSARVTAIDYAKRTATLMDSDGKRFTVKVSPDAVNFDQVKPGDMVKATVTEELVVYLAGGREPKRDAAMGMVALAPKGSQPGGVVAETVRITGTVIALDRASQTATLRFEDGSMKTFPVRGDVDLSKRKVGEQVVFLVTEMIALKVEKP